MGKDQPLISWNPETGTVSKMADGEDILAVIGVIALLVLACFGIYHLTSLARTKTDTEVCPTYDLNDARIITEGE